ncbi:MAG TPA: hypothetical protein VGQ42_07005 [Candidatus Dormibacteraeota bacterium]|nr:hypothetical protein [Candidatus Dormibacteraeota bacterium]
MKEPLGERLRAWQGAGLIDAGAARAIANFEAARGRHDGGNDADGEEAQGLSASEALTYVGVAVVLAGILFGLFTGLSTDAIGPVALFFAAVATGLGVALQRGTTASGRRAAGAAFTIAAAMAALGTGELLAGAHAFTSTAAVTAAAAAVALVLFLVVLRVTPVGLAALLAAAAAFTTSMSTAWAAGHEAAMRTGWAPLIAGALLLLVASRTRSPGAAAVLRFSAVSAATGILLIVGQIPDANPWLLIAMATVISLAAVVVAVRLSANELAVAGGIGIFGVALDATARTLGRDAGAPVVLIVSGLLLVACAALVQQAIRHNRAGQAG